MRFNVDRLCELAGIDSSGRLLAESKHPMKYEEDEADVPAAKAGGPPPPAAKAPPPAAKPMKEKSLAAVETMDLTKMEDEYGMDGDVLSDMMEDEGDYAEGDYAEGDYAEDDEVVYEIDEQELNEAIYQMRSQRIEEGKVRQQVRRELKQVVSEMTSGSSWMYGNKQPTNSQAGRINRGFAGPGFKR